MARMQKLLLLVSLLAVQHAILCQFAEAKELEGFGDEIDEEFEEEQELIAETTTPKKPPPTSQAADSERDSEQAKPASRSSDAPAAKKPSQDEWDDEEFEGVPVDYPNQGPVHGSKPEPKKPAKRVVAPPQPRKPFKAEDYVPEIVFLVFLVVFAVNYFIGSWANERIALAWVDQFATNGGTFEKNFSLLGTGDTNNADDPLMIKEGQTIFKFYASGRRYCQSVLVTLDLRARQDLLSLIWYLIFPAQDTMKVDVLMNEDSMQPFIVAVVRRKQAKAYLKDHKDLKDLCNIMDFSFKRKWPVNDFAVMGDNREVASEILSDAIVEQLFAGAPFEQFVKKYLLAMHFSDQWPSLVNRKVLRFEFALPPAKKMDQLQRLVASIPFFIDSVARVVLSAVAKTKAEEKRTKANAASLREEQERRQEEIQRKREERRKALEAKMSPAELAKKKEKERLKDLRPRSKVTRLN